MEIWPVDPLVKVFRDDSPGPGDQIRMECARNAFVNGQLAIRSEESLEVSVACASLQHDQQERRLQCMPRFIGYVHVRESVRETPPDEKVRSRPGEFPDYLRRENPVRVSSEETQPIWLTVFVPPSVSPGTYSGSISVLAGEIEEPSEVELTVHRAIIPDENKLHVTNWLKPAQISRYSGIPNWCNEHWRLLRAHANSMAKHRQDTILTPLSLIKITRNQEKIDLDFTRFDKWIQMFRSCGVDGLIEGGHLARRGKDWESDFVLRSWKIEGMDNEKSRPLPVDSEECEEFLSQFLPGLQEHLEERGWIEKYVQHLADEPTQDNLESYRYLARTFHKYAPDIKRIDAIQTTDLIGDLEVWVPELDHFHENMDFYMDRMKRGEKVWFYTCLNPKGRYPNRFIDLPLLKVRILHWINFRYHLPGYLHWGYNYWTDDPYRDTQPDWSNGQPLPAGDMCIVYPGKDGPLESLRYEAMRDGIQDYELLNLLSKHDTKKATQLCQKIVLNPTDYVRDASKFRRIRSELLRCLDKAMEI